jgi:hypothetical protein
MMQLHRRGVAKHLGDIPGPVGVVNEQAIPLGGNMSGVGTWPADPVAQFATNLATLKTLTAPAASPLTLTVQPAGTTVTAVRTGLEVGMVTEFFAEVTLTFRLLQGTV